MASLTSLPADAEQLLSLIRAGLSAQGVQLPERCYVQPGSMPVWDGEQLTCGLMGIAQGQPGLAQPTTFAPEAVHYYATLFVLLVRPVTVAGVDGFSAVEIPTAQAQDADGQAAIADSAALLLAAQQIHASHSLTGPGEGFVIEGCQPLGPEGALAANRLLLSISLS